MWEISVLIFKCEVKLEPTILFSNSQEKPPVGPQLRTATLIFHSNLHCVLINNPETALESDFYLSQPEQKLPHTIQ